MWIGGTIGLIFVSLNSATANSYIKLFSLLVPSFGKIYLNLPDIAKLSFSTFFFTYVGCILGSALYTSFSCILPCIIITGISTSIDKISVYTSQSSIIDQTVKI